MGETAEAPVEGEEANADKPEEDGELDEDFILPEEGELPEEDAEPEIPEIDFSTLSVAISAESDVVELGGDMVLTAVLTGFEDLNYTLQWQFSTDNANWANVDPPLSRPSSRSTSPTRRKPARRNDAPVFPKSFLEAAHRLAADSL